MAGIFTPGKASQTDVQTFSPADIASKLFAIKLLLSRLAQSGGAPQTLGEYIKSGPRKLDPGVTAEASSGLMSALSQPGAFQGHGLSRTGKPASPSLFQDASSGLVTLAMLSSLLKGQGGISGTVGSGYDWLKNLIGGSGQPDLGQGIPSLGAGSSFDASGANLMDSLGGIGSATDQVPYASAGDSSSAFLDSLLSYGSY